MSVDTEQFTRDTPIIRTLTAEMLDGRAFASVTPQSWRLGITDAIPTALATLANQREQVGSLTDQEVGERFYQVLNEVQAANGDTPLRTRPAAVYIAFGSYLRAAASRLDETTDDDTLTVTVMPPSPWSSNDHVARYQALQEWATNGVPDIKAGVDEQMAYLSSEWRASTMEPGWGSCCGTDGRHKDFLGNVMRYKAFLLDNVVVPEVGMLLRIDEALNRGAYYAIGDVVKVTHASTASRTAFQTEWVSGPGVWKSQTLFRDEVRRHHLVSDSETDVPQRDAQDQATLDQQSDEIARLTARLAEAETRASNWEHDFTHLADNILRQAVRREWCSEYEEFSDSTESGFKVASMPRREQDFDVAVSGYLRIPFTYTVTVTAGDSDQAYEIVNDDPQDRLPSAADLAQYNADRYSAEIEDSDLDVEVQ